MAPTTTNSAKPSKSEFIRQQPSTLSAADVVEKAKAQGIDLRPGLVYEVRRTLKTKKTGPARRPFAPAKKAPKVASAAPRSVLPKKPATSKAAYVRAHADLSPKEIVETARLEGIRLDVGYVYNVRGAQKAAAKKRGAPQTSRRATPRNGGERPVAAKSSAEGLLKAVAAEIGLGRAIELLQGEREKVRAVFEA